MSTVPLVRDMAGGAVLQVRLHPGAKQDAVTGVHESGIKISLKMPPVVSPKTPIEGRANAALIDFLAARLRIPRARVSLLAGVTLRSKTIRIEGRSAAEVEAALLGPVEA